MLLQCGWGGCELRKAGPQLNAVLPRLVLTTCRKESVQRTFWLEFHCLSVLATVTVLLLLRSSYSSLLVLMDCKLSEVWSLQKPRATITSMKMLWALCRIPVGASSGHAVFEPSEMGNVRVDVCLIVTRAMAQGHSSVWPVMCNLCWFSQ